MMLLLFGERWGVGGRSIYELVPADDTNNPQYRSHVHVMLTYSNGALYVDSNTPI